MSYFKHLLYVWCIKFCFRFLTFTTTRYCVFHRDEQKNQNKIIMIVVILLFFSQAVQGILYTDRTSIYSAPGWDQCLNNCFWFNTALHFISTFDIYEVYSNEFSNTSFHDIFQCGPEMSNWYKTKLLIKFATKSEVFFSVMYRIASMTSERMLNSTWSRLTKKLYSGRHEKVPRAAAWWFSKTEPIIVEHRLGKDESQEFSFLN